MNTEHYTQTLVALRIDTVQGCSAVTQKEKIVPEHLKNVSNADESKRELINRLFK